MNRAIIDRARQALITFLFLAGATCVGYLFRRWGVPETNIVVVYILSVLLTARFTEGYGWGVGASIAATVAFDFFFTEPYHALRVDDPSYLVTFAVMALTAMTTGALTSSGKQSAVDARDREAITGALFRLTNHLTDAADIESIVSIAVQTVSDAFSCQAACLPFDAKGMPERSFLQQRSKREQIHRSLENREEVGRRITELHTAFAVGDEFYDWPIYGHDAVLAIMRIPIGTAKTLSGPQLRLLHSIIESTALALDRCRSAQERTRSREEAEQEHYRGNLLRAISHDLRTPLSGIMGTSEMLMDMTEPNDERHSLAEAIYRDADWLHSLVENILNLTRLQDGRLTLNKQPEPVEEVVGGAVIVAERREPGREIAVTVPDSVLMVPMDARLIEQVLVNLLDNARKHTPLDKEISVTVEADEKGENAVFTVADHGSGISPTDLPHIFQMFYTSHAKGADSKRGIGLGLTICESIVKAHGGTITGGNREDDSGAVFTFTLPLEVQRYDTTS